MEEVTITKMVHGGQGLGELADGRKVFVWNALPGEVVRVRVIRKKRSYAEAIAEEIMSPSPDRIEPRETHYLATSPWQMMTFEAENRHKVAIVHDLFAHRNSQADGTGLISGQEEQPEQKPFFLPGAMRNPETGVSYGYRNKMEYSFWGDEDGLHLALHQRGSHGKQIVEGSALAMPAVDMAAQAVLDELRRLHIRAGDLKTLVIRCDQNGNAVAALFVKPSAFPRLDFLTQTKSSHPAGGPDALLSGSAFGGLLQGIRVYHSNPKSPASVRTQLLYEIGGCELTDTLLGREFRYDVDSFFQVNLPIYEQALTSIREHCVGDPIDLYAGVGSIGLSVAKKQVTLVELDPATAAMARTNLSLAQGLSLSKVVEGSSERALEHVAGDRPIIVDPPRAGLHPAVVDRCLAVLPPQIMYLSCNPATQVRDLELLAERYRIVYCEVFNFFPRTPHIETLVVLERRGD